MIGETDPGSCLGHALPKRQPANFGSHLRLERLQAKPAAMPVVPKLAARCEAAEIGFLPALLGGFRAGSCKASVEVVAACRPELVVAFEVRIFRKIANGRIDGFQLPSRHWKNVA